MRRDSVSASAEGDTPPRLIRCRLTAPHPFGANTLRGLSTPPYRAASGAPLRGPSAVFRHGANLESPSEWLVYSRAYRRRNVCAVRAHSACLGDGAAVFPPAPIGCVTFSPRSARLTLSHEMATRPVAQPERVGGDHVDMFGTESRRSAAGRIHGPRAKPTTPVTINHCSRPIGDMQSNS